jgi:hypothetical protein
VPSVETKLIGWLRSHGLAFIWLLVIGALVNFQSRIWDSHLWVGDLGNLPYQATRMCWGDIIYRDFAAKNPIGVFLFPYLIFRLLGSCMDALAWTTTLQFTLFLTATYLLARRSAPRCAWIVLPLSLKDALVSCGLLHHLWAGTVGLLAIPALYAQLFSRQRKTSPGWLQAGLILGIVGLFHQVLLAALWLAVVIYALSGLATSQRLHRLSMLVKLSLVALLTILSGYGLLAVFSGPDFSLLGTGLASTLKFLGTHQGQPANSVWTFSDLLVFAPAAPGFDGQAQRFLEVAQRVLSYLGFPLLATWALLRPRASEENQDQAWFPWLLLSGGLMCLAAFPQFGFVHIRAFVAPLSYVVLAYLVESQAGSWALSLLAALVSLLGVGDAAVTLAIQRWPVHFPAGTVYVSSPREANDWKAICSEMSSQSNRTSLLVYPYFPMAYFLFQRQNVFPIHEIYPGRILFHTGVTVEHPLYRQGMQKALENPPLFAIQAIGIQQLFGNLENLQKLNSSDPEPANPLLEMIESRYSPVYSTRLDDGSPWIVLRKHK